MVKFYSFNVRGLRNERKRRAIFDFLKRKQYDIIFLQETHSTKDIEIKWKKEWGGEISFSNFTSMARGTMTLFKPGLNSKFHWNDAEGRIDYNIVTLGANDYSCINIYAPNLDSKQNIFSKGFLV